MHLVVRDVDQCTAERNAKQFCALSHLRELRQVFTRLLERRIVQHAARFDAAFFAALKSVLCFVHRETSYVSLEFENTLLSCHGILCLKFSLLFFWHSRDRPLLQHGKHRIDKRAHQNSPDRFRRFVPFIPNRPIVPFVPDRPVENNGVYLLVTY